MTNEQSGRAIYIAGYDPEWPGIFERERKRIVRVCGDDAFASIEHIGSTSVPGLAAKPIIDMMPGLLSLDDARALIEPLSSLGYEYVPRYEQPIPEMDDPGMPFRRYFRKDVGGVRAFHMHMVETTSDFWRDQLLFRDCLRSIPADADAYAALKRRLAAEYSANTSPDRETNRDYTNRKSELIAEIKSRARTETGGALA